MTFDKNNNLKENIKRDTAGKGDGKPYIDWINERYSKMTEEEKKEVDAYGEMIAQKLNLTDKDNNN